MSRLNNSPQMKDNWIHGYYEITDTLLYNTVYIKYFEELNLFREH